MHLGYNTSMLCILAHWLIFLFFDTLHTEVEHCDNIALSRSLPTMTLTQYSLLSSSIWVVVEAQMALQCTAGCSCI